MALILADRTRDDRSNQLYIDLTIAIPVFARTVQDTQYTVSKSITPPPPMHALPHYVGV